MTLSQMCWPHTGYINPAGYGHCNTGSVHRRVYEVLVGPVPDGLELDHLCRNRACYNPRHLEPVPHRVNVQRGEAGRYPRADRCVHGHLYDEANTGWWHNKRQCRACDRRRAAARRAAR